MSEEIAAAAKIEPTLKPIEDAPSIAAAAPDAPPAEAVKIEPTIDAKAAEQPTAEATAAEAATFVASGPAPKEPPAMPRAAQISIEPPESKSAKHAPIWLRPVRADDAKPAAAAPARNAGRRFAMLAATVAVAAGFGAIAGSFGATRLSPAPEVTVAHATKDTTDEIKALKETVAQLRTNTKTLNDNLSALKLSMSSANAQLTKMSEAIERRPATPAAAPPASEITGSIKQPAPMVLGTPPATLQHPIVQGWTLRRVFDGSALIEGREGIIEVEPGTTLPGLGRIEDIKKQDGRWVVLTSKGLIVAGK